MPKNTLPRRASAPKKPKTAIIEPINRHAEDIAARDARIAATLDLKGLDDSERAFLATCQMILRRWTGCNAPFEEFFRCLVLRVESNMWPTPEDVERELKTFKENFEDMRRDARNFLETYRDELEPWRITAAPEAAHA
jgi:hypothetical protein